MIVIDDMAISYFQWLAIQLAMLLDHLQRHLINYLVLWGCPSNIFSFLFCGLLGLLSHHPKKVYLNIPFFYFSVTIIQNIIYAHQFESTFHMFKFKDKYKIKHATYGLDET